jgi:hypothetical protein
MLFGMIIKRCGTITISVGGGMVGMESREVVLGTVMLIQ